MLLAFSEPHETAVLLLVLGILITFSVFFSRWIDRLGIPVVLFFLVVGILGGSEGFGNIAFDDYAIAVRIGTIYLILILFDGGMNTSVAAVRRVLLPASLLATVGVLLTAGATALFARWLGLSWIEALLIGAVASSTDAAAVLSVLRGGKMRLRPRVGDTLEIESCVNDPMAVILTVAVIQVALAGEADAGWLLLTIPAQLVIGAVVGVTFGAVGRWGAGVIRPMTVGLYPAATLALAFLSFGVATVCGGSGFLGVFATALVLGSGPLPHRSALKRIHDALAWLSQVALFLMLGLLVLPSELIGVSLVGVMIAVFLAAIARPLAVWLILYPLGYPRTEILYIGWIGLRGAVPIILGTFPVLAGVPGAERVFNVVFFVVVISALVPGATIRAVTEWLKLASPELPAPGAVLEINSAHRLTHEIASFFIDDAAAVCGASLAQVRLPLDAAVMMVVRKSELIAARGATVLKPGDHVYVFFRPESQAYIELLFGRREVE